MNISLKNTIAILNLSSIAMTIGFAIFLGQYFQIVPCKLCMYQRYFGCFMIVIICMMYPFIQDYKKITAILILLFIVASSLSILHILVEHGYIQYQCQTAELLQTVEDVRQSIYKTLPSCNNISLKIFGISLSIMNLIFNVVMIIINCIFISWKQKV